MYLPTFKPAGSGRPLVFLHGLGGNADSFDAQFAQFSVAWHCIAWNMPGYGGSPLPAEFTWQSLSAALARLLDHLSLPRAILIGHSMGGMVAQEFVARHPERVEALVLSATSAMFGSADGSFQREFLASRLKPIEEGKTPADIADALVAGMIAEPRDPDVVAWARRQMARIPAATYRAALTCLAGFDRRGDLAAIPCPTLLLAAEKDATAPPRGMARMAEKIPGARYHCVAGAGHLVQAERPTAFNAALQSFLAGLPR
ncbi:MAG: alpha/beta fold hydrolase [Alphaproteobacteria bacterium]|nr:alpha/beta fold hydrolase [Alphaproteobacteria bacterium]